MSDSPQAEYEAKRLSTKMNLRKYYNDCVAVMAREQVGEITEKQAEIEFIALDQKWARSIVDDISPKRSIIQV